MAYLLCFSCDGSTPIFTRNQDFGQIPFAVSGCLEGLRIFSENANIELKNACSTTCQVHWKSFEKSISLILLRKNISIRTDVSRELEWLLKTIVFLYGEEDLSSIKIVERLKREIRVSYKLLDHLLSKQPTNFITKTIEIAVLPNYSELQAQLTAFCEKLHTPYGFLVVKSRLVGATTQWFDLSSVEQCLLLSLIDSHCLASASDLPVFLPDCSPNVPHRLLLVQLSLHITLALICGLEPTMTDYLPQVESFWTPHLPLLSSVAADPAPPSQRFHPDLLAFLLVLPSHGTRCMALTSKANRDVQQNAIVSRLDDFYIVCTKETDPCESFSRNTDSAVYFLPDASDSSVTKHLCALFAPTVGMQRAEEVANATLAQLVSDRTLMKQLQP